VRTCKGSLGILNLLTHCGGIVLRVTLAEIELALMFGLIDLVKLVMCKDVSEEAGLVLRLSIGVFLLRWLDPGSLRANASDTEEVG
jgi:hypothetical protein